MIHLMKHSTYLSASFIWQDIHKHQRLFNGFNASRRGSGLPSNSRQMLLAKLPNRILGFIALIMLLTSACTANQQTKPSTAIDHADSSLNIEQTWTPLDSSSIVATQPLTSTPQQATQSQSASSPILTPLAPISPEDWQRGPRRAAVDILVYADFQCRNSARLAKTLSQLLAAHPNDLRIIFRHFPLQPLHDKAFLAGEAAEAAGAQASFWEMHDLLFERQEIWRNLDASSFQEWLIRAASELGFNSSQFEQDLSQNRFAPKLEQAFLDGLTSGLTGTPMIFINGSQLSLPPNLTNLEATIRLELLEKRQFASRPPIILQPSADYTAHLHLDNGEVAIRLFPQSARLAVNSFIFLAEHGWFDDTQFHRVLPGMLVESGDPSGTGFGGPGYTFPTEIDPVLTFDQPGMVALCSEAPGTNGSRFFITLRPMPQLNGTRTIFGRVVEGLDLINALGRRDPIDNLLDPAQTTIRAVTIEQQ